MKFPMGDQDEQDLLDRIAALRLKLMKGMFALCFSGLTLRRFLP